MRRVLLLGFAGLLAGAGLYLSSGSSGANPPPAAIAGAPIEGAREQAAFESLATQPVAPRERAVPEATLKLDAIERVGDHYEAPLGDKRVTLTLDPVLQEQAEKLLAEARAPRAAIVAMTPDGKILALAGRRTEEPKGGRKGTPDPALALEPWAPAASVFKLVTASALVTDHVDPEDKVCYHGGIRSVSESNLRDDKRDNNCQTLTYGVAHSNNAILGKLAFQHLEPAELAQMAIQLGLGTHEPGLGTTGEIDLPKDKDLAFAQAAAGFTGSKLSALGGALLAATFADGGEQPAPRLVADASPAALHRVLPEDIAHQVARMMVATCEYGSAARAFGRHRAVSVAGKTGTLTRTDPFYMEHSWFVGYAPADKPEIVVAVVLGNPESWHLRAQEAARRLIDRALISATGRESDRGDAPAKRAKRR
ncbi:MAG: penicillin-binding transpeptidase domain-containing protein [Acidobacteriota bacterium]